MQIVYRKNVDGEYVDAIIKITSAAELAEIIVGNVIPLRRPINDFKCFNSADLPYINSVILSDVKYDRSQFYKKFLSKIFKYRTKGQIGYWISRGWTENDARCQVSNTQRRLASGFRAAAKRNGTYNQIFNTTTEFYISRGFSKEEAIRKVKERQSTFTLAKCIERYGESDGKKRFNERQSKWMASLYNRSDEALKKMFRDRTNHTFGVASGTSLKVFLPLIQWCNENGVTTDEILIGHGTSSEFCLVDSDTKKVYFYDFTIPKLQLIIEYNGELWHPRNSDWAPLPCMNTTMEEAMEKEKSKKITAEKNGYTVHYIWDSDDVDSAIETCRSLIRSQLSKVKPAQSTPTPSC